MKKNLLSSILVFVALAISAATMIPFSSKTVGVNEALIKFIVFPLAVLVIVVAILFINKKKDAKAEKDGLFGISLALVSYIGAAAVYLVTVALRLGENPILLVSGLIGFLVVTAFGLLITRLEAKIDYKKALVMPLVAVFVFIFTLVFAVVNRYENVLMTNNTSLSMILAIILAVVVTCAYACEYFLIARRELTEAEVQVDEFVYGEMTDKELNDVYEFSKNELEKRGLEYDKAVVEVIKEVPVEKEVVKEVVKEVPVEKEVIKEVEVVKEVPVEKEVIKEVIKEVPVVKEVEVIKEVIKEVPVEVIKEVEVAPVVQPKAPKAKKEKVEIKPTPQEIAAKALYEFDDIEIKFGKDDENFKVLRKRKPILICQRTNNDYRLTYQRKPISAAKMLIKYPGACVKATSPAGEQWFKFTNKGEIEEKDIFDAIIYTHKYSEDVEAKELAKKEKAKAREAAKKAKAREKAKEAAKKAKEREKAKAKALQEKEAKKALQAAKAKAKEEAKVEAKAE